MPMFKRFEYCHHCACVMGDETYVCPAFEARVCPECWAKCQDAGYAPAAGLETDERFMQEWIEYGIGQLGTMLANEARMDAAIAGKVIHWEGGDENDALS